MKDSEEIHEGSVNVFADIGHPNAEEMFAKAGIVSQISRIIESRKLAKKQAAALLGITQAKFAALRRGRLSEFTPETLFWFLGALDRTSGIRVRNRRPERRKAA